MINVEDANRTAELFAAIAEPTRLQVIHHLVSGPLHVGRLAELIGIPLANLSHHLVQLRYAGILDGDKVGRKVNYSLRKELFKPGDVEHVGIFHFGRYRITIRRSPTPIPTTKPRPRDR